ncbi:hypothetical protein L6452_22831 [Arctium lappa]|uniref:Uncharacterized protein n=1 Tax=Arctium lappa TaxID=4217 RepID=A0ACB9B182_ARCLA|nr:hypothetical protein L6452_22831 [Arctium lappa]
MDEDGRRWLFIVRERRGRDMKRQLITDDLRGSLYHIGIDRITEPAHANYTYSIVAGMNFMVPYNYTKFIDGLAYLVKNKFISMSRVDDAVKRILRVKFVMGLFENPLADYSMAKYLGSQEHINLAREAVRKTLVLLKNGIFKETVVTTS